MALNVFSADSGFFTQDLIEILRSCHIDNDCLGEIISDITNFPTNLTKSDFKILNIAYNPYAIPDSKFGFKLTGLDICVSNYSDCANVCLTGMYNIEEPNWVYFPFWFAIVGLMRWHHFFNKNPSLPETRKYNFSCLNKYPKVERIWFYTQLHQTSIFNNTLTSFYHITNDGKQYIDNDKILPGVLENQYYPFELDPYTVDYFVKNIYPTLPHCTDCDKLLVQENPQYFSHGIDHPAFEEAYVNIVSEHSYVVPFLSEKSVKPFAAEQLFLMAGPQGAVTQLEKMGFDTYKDIIDHNYYDKEQYWKTRLTKMLKLAQSFTTGDIEKMFAETRERRIKNRLYLFSTEFQHSILEPLKTWINQNI